MKTVLLVVAVITMASIAGAAAVMLPNNAGDTDMNQMPEIVYIAPGEEWILSLDENPTTGYTWSVISSDGLKVTDTYEPSAGDADIVGAGGVREYRISADEPGEYGFSAKYARSWESTEYDRIVSFKLIVG